MASFWLKVVTNQAEFALCWVLVIQPPQQRHSSRISDSDYHIRPNTHDVEEGSNNQPSDMQVFPLSHKELIDVKEEDEKKSDDYANEIWIFDRELAARSYCHIIIRKANSKAWMNILWIIWHSWVWVQFLHLEFSLLVWKVKIWALWDLSRC